MAISTACGALDHIVCDTMDTAQMCVNYLKINNIGSATFIGLDKVSNKYHCAIEGWKWKERGILFYGQGIG